MKPAPLSLHPLIDMTREGWQRRLPGLESLWQQTEGDRSITIAVLDGAVDLSHPCFSGADLRVVEDVVANAPPSGHGTAVASILWGQPSSSFAGLAPGCRGLIIPIFATAEQADVEISPCSQVDIARAIGLALTYGANVINISGGQLDAGGEASPVLAKAIRNCIDQGVLVVAAAGNNGCDCHHVPAAVPQVLAVGAMDDEGTPIPSSNWGLHYHSQGLLAPGQGIPAAAPGGGIVALTGSSFAAPIVAGIAALLLSLQIRRGQSPNISAVRAALLATTRGCAIEPIEDCRRLLGGRLDVAAAVARIGEEVAAAAKPSNLLLPPPEGGQPAAFAVSALTEFGNVAATAEASMVGTVADVGLDPAALTPTSDAAAGVTPSEVAKGFELAEAAAESPVMSARLVYALGRLGYDFGVEVRRDSLRQHGLADPDDPRTVLSYLAENPAYATSLIFTLLVGGTPIYALAPVGPFAAETYELLRKLVAAQLSGDVERVSIPGYTLGTAKLLTGHTVPLVYPELRGIYGWSTQELVQEVLGAPSRRGKAQLKSYENKAAAVTNFLERVTYEIRSPGLTPPERAINYAATNAFQLKEIYSSATATGLELDVIAVEPNPICRPAADCWDVKLTFFNPARRLEQARLAYRFTIDVSDVVPVRVGPVRHWHVY